MNHFTKSWTWTDPLIQHKQWKGNMRFGMWNVRSLCRSGSFKTGATELAGMDYVDLVDV
jgi:hypothetical protein